jgi:rhamnosyl/mannosyltransferase
VAEKVVTIPLGVPDVEKETSLTDGRFANREHSEIDGILNHVGNRKIIVSIGRLIPYKGFEYIVEAAQFIPNNSVFIIVGTGPLESFIESKISEFGVSDRVILAGRLEDSDLRDLFKLATLYCMSSVERSEACGVVLIEAMAWGLPIVATDIEGSGVPWVNCHEKTGLNVPPCNARALAQACTEILEDDRLRNRMAFESRRRFENEFTEHLNINRTLEIYNNCL